MGYLAAGQKHFGFGRQLVLGTSLAATVGKKVAGLVGFGDAENPQVAGLELREVKGLDQTISKQQR